MMCERSPAAFGGSPPSQAGDCFVENARLLSPLRRGTAAERQGVAHKPCFCGISSLAAVPIPPTGSADADVSYGMDNARRNHQLFAGLGTKDLAVDLEFHSPVLDHDHFVRVMTKVFPPLSRRVGPQAAAEAALSPSRFRAFLINDFVYSSSAVSKLTAGAASLP